MVEPLSRTLSLSSQWYLPCHCLRQLYSFSLELGPGVPGVPGGHQLNVLLKESLDGCTFCCCLVSSVKSSCFLLTISLKMYTICDCCCRVKGEQCSLCIGAGRLLHLYNVILNKLMCWCMSWNSQPCHSFKKHPIETRNCY